MRDSFRSQVRWTWLCVAAVTLLQTSCGGREPVTKDYTVGIADRIDYQDKRLTLHNFRLYSEGFLVTENLPPADQLKGKVLLQVAGLKRATQVSSQLATGLQLSTAPPDSAQAKVWRERVVNLADADYLLTEFPTTGESRNISPGDVDVIILEPQ